MNQEPLVFKVAAEDWEFEQIHRLNYKTFVEEIPQHQASPSQRLVDKFHPENTYLICLQNQKLIGMLAVRGSRPFSLDQKLPNLDSFLPPGRTICEIRLLAIEKKFRGARGGQVLQGILALLWQHGVEKNYGLAIISGTTRQSKLYQHLGFVPFGTVVGGGDAQFQPMYVTLETFEVTAREFLRSSPARSFHPNAVNFLPGPVTVRREVRRAFEQAPESHRGESFKKEFQSTKQALTELVRAKNVELFMGSGTLANDIVAAQLSLLEGRGLVLSNGEFGDRLIDHAQRMGLNFDTLKFDWREPIESGAVEKKLGVSGKSAYSWLWCAHCETSTGLMADLGALKQLCAQTGTRLCLDCISSVGSMAVDLSDIFLASCASGKGLRAYPGLSMIFYNHDIAPQAGSKLPRYLDMDYYARQEGIPFTFSSNLLHALRAAVRRVNWEKRFSDIDELSVSLRQRLVESGFKLIGNGASVSPAVITIQLPEEVCSVKFGGAMQEAGYLLSFNSGYLRSKNWVQVCLMGECTREKVVALGNSLNRAYSKLKPGHLAEARA
ncbi:MAG TPA: aminotransferase class V-fold PLP-dependent enzyme [Verrucomicrobiae bacterium]|jgi:aspartate aminotransferase-like enzyme|nr:aminotransferase class V-fold PLP-dependent enzyme [Verrucomicrobiae bacterium]